MSMEPKFLFYFIKPLLIQFFRKKVTIFYSMVNEENIPRWFGYAMSLRREKAVKTFMKMNIERKRRRGRLKKRCLDAIEVNWEMLLYM